MFRQILLLFVLTTSIIAQTLPTINRLSDINTLSGKALRMSKNSNWIFWNTTLGRYQSVRFGSITANSTNSSEFLLASPKYGSSSTIIDTTQNMYGWYKLRGYFDFTNLSDADTTKHGILILSRKVNINRIGSFGYAPVLYKDSTWNRPIFIRANGRKDTLAYLSDIVAGGGTVGGWTLSNTTPKKLYQNAGIKTHIRSVAGDTTGTALFNVYGTAIFGGTNTFNGDLIFGASADLTLPTADPTPDIGKLWRSTDVLKYTNSAGDAKTLVIGTGTANELTYWSGTNSLGTLSTATYPSLTELLYVKGVTSAIQTQLNGKLTSGLTNTYVFVGNGSNIATGVAMSGDATISNLGAVTVANDSHDHTGSTISGLAVTDFTSPNISNWTNNSGYITLVSLSGVSPISYNNGTGAISFLTNTDITWTGNHYYNGTGTKTYFGSGHYLQLPNYAGATGGMVKYDALSQKVYVVNNAGSDVELAYQTNATIPPASNTADNIPLWDGTNSKTLKNGLQYTSAATVSTIVGRDGSAHSAFNAITLGTASQYGQLTIYGTTYNTLFTTQAATSNKWIEFPNLTGTVLLTTSSAGSFPTLNQNTTGSSGSTTGNAATVTNGAYVSASNTFTASNNRFRNALYLGDNDYTTDGQLIFDNGTNAYTATLTAPNTTTSNKTITLPDATGTVTLLETDQTFTGDISFDDAVILKETAVSDTDNDIDATDKSYIRLGYTPGSYTISTISNGIAGQILILCVTSSGNTWTVNNGTGANNIRLNGATNYAMGQYDTLTIIYDSGAGTWIETARSDN